MNFNKVLLLGNLTRDPELKALTNGGSIATFTLATNRRVKKGNEKVEQPEFHNIVVFGKQGRAARSFSGRAASRTSRAVFKRGHTIKTASRSTERRLSATASNSAHDLLRAT
jgi:single-strand DNA-binding protein